MSIINPFWNSTETKAIIYPALTENSETEICVIGAGIAGLSIAYRLLQAGKKVLVLDKNFGQGETGRSSAHLMSALDDRYYEIEKMHGSKKARLAAESHIEAINWIETVIEKEQIDCGFKRVSGFLFEAQHSKTELEKEYSAAQRVGVQVDFTNLGKFGKALNFANQARFNPRKYLEGLAAAVCKKGGQIYDHSTVVKVDFKKKEVVLENNKVVKAHYIITAANAPIFSSFSLLFKLNPQRTYVIGIKVPKGSVQDALYWDTENPYHYVRIEEYDADSDMLIVGGEDHRVGLLPSHNPFLKLQQWAEKYFEINALPIAYQWSGQILEPVDYLAFIGRNPQNKDAFLVSGDSGNGLTHGTLAAALIADLILIGQSPYEEVYKIKRLPIRAFGKVLANMGASSKAYLQYLIPQWKKLPTAGEGKIIQRGFRKMAFYKDEKTNILHQCSGVCSHLGAVLSWNPIEKTWDCPAHGSRFDVDGKFLNGPTQHGLKCTAQSSK